MNKEMVKILIVDDNPKDISSFQQHLREVKNLHCRADVATNFLDGFNQMLHNKHDIYFINYALGTHLGSELIEFATQRHLTAPSILLTMDAEQSELTNESVPAGLYDFLPKTELTKSVLERTIRYALAHKTIESHLEQTKKQAEVTLASIHDGVIAITHSGKICYLNPSAAMLLGGHINDFIDKSIFDYAEFMDLARELPINEEIKAVLAHSEEFKQQQDLCITNKINKRYDIELIMRPIPAQEINDEKLSAHAIITLRNVTEAKQLASELLFQATHDSVTKLPNRKLFEDRLQNLLVHAKRYNYIFAVLFLDLDGFKQINETSGHHSGDVLLEAVAARLKECIRDTDTLARFGGDEFVLLLSTLRSSEDAAKICELILKVMTRPFFLNNKEHYITASMGISVYPQDGDNPEVLVGNADTAMYLAKSKGKNNFQFYTAALHEKAVENLKLNNDFRSSLQRGHFELHYQPQIDCHTGTLRTLEALTRWNHPEHGLIRPEKFIPLAEENGFIGLLGEWIFYNAAQQLRNWMDAGLDGFKLALNCSVKQLEKKNMPARLLEILAEFSLQPTSFELEITESAFIHDSPDVIDILHELRNLGFGIAIDDFGMGYSCLSYLKSLPIDIIKIDQSFIKNISHNPHDAGITKAIIALAHSLNMEVLAEGVENEQQRDFLINNHCHLMQGYLFGKPLPVQEITQYLTQPTIPLSAAR